MTDPPEILIIHLIRNRYGKNLRRKDSALISFSETLDIREFTVGDEIPGKYHLKAVASHIGSKVDGGHYIAFCKIEEEWWKFSDIEYGQVKAEEVFEGNFPVHEESEQTATLLMYSGAPSFMGKICFKKGIARISQASPLLRDIRGDLLQKRNCPNIPGQAHMKFADGDEPPKENPDFFRCHFA